MRTIAKLTKNNQKSNKVDSCNLKYGRMLFSIINFTYIKEKDINQIRSDYQKHNNTGTISLIQKSAMYGKILKLMIKQSYQSVKEDFIAFKSIKRKNQAQLNDVEKERLMRIYDDLRKCLGPIIVAILPFAAPLMLLYIYKLPDFTPSWVIIDAVHQKLLLQRKKRRKEAAEYFKANKPEIIDCSTKQINLIEMNLQELKKISQLCFGYYYNGAVVFNRLLSTKFEYFISQSVSRYIVLDKMAQLLGRDIINRMEIKDMCVEQQILWKIKKSIKQIEHADQFIANDKGV